MKLLRTILLLLSIMCFALSLKSLKTNNNSTTPPNKEAKPEKKEDKEDKNSEHKEDSIAKKEEVKIRDSVQTQQGPFSPLNTSQRLNLMG